jgi:Peptidase M30/PKD domain
MTLASLKTRAHHIFLAFGLAALLSACGGGGGGAGSGANSIAANGAPVARISAKTNVVLGDTVLVSGANSSDPEGEAISYAWALLSQPSTSTQILPASSSSTLSFVPSVLGAYVVRLTVTDPSGKTNQASITINLVNNSAPLANAGVDQTAFANSTVVLNGSASSDANGDSLTYAWTMANKPASSSATLINPATVNPSFTADLTGVYTLSLVVTDSRGSSSVADLVRVTASANPLATACGSVACAAVSSSQYAGSGLGIWRYHNATSASSAIDIDISNVPAGKKIGLFFSNAQSTAATSLPSAGINASLEPQAEALSTGLLDMKALLLKSGLSHTEASLQLDHDSTHEQMMQRNKLLKTRIGQSLQVMPNADAISETSAPRFSPVVGAGRNWVDYFPTPAVSYPTTNKFVCTLPSGRNAVFWQQNSDTNLTSAMLTQFTNAACGINGGFARIASLLGDAWGDHSFSNLITDTGTKQDINIVFLNAGSSAQWAGYFYGLNNFKSTASQPTNEALAFFINTNQLTASNSGITDFYISTLFHEATHMHNFYQNDIVRDKTLQTWMEEMHAVMSEDIVTPSVTPNNYNKLKDYRIPGYLNARGGVDLINWPANLGSTSGNYYGMAAALGGYINRQYGIGVYQQLTSSCTTGLAKTNSYECLKSVLTTNGSPSLAEDFSRMGASTYGFLSATGNPTGFGFPSKSDGGYNLTAIDLSSNTWSTAAATSVSPSFKATTQWYAREVQATNKTRYIRNGVSVPANTTLHLVIKD